MAKRLVRLEGRPLLDIASYARGGLSRRDRLSPTEIEQISLTVRRAPEVMVKVLTRGGQDLKSTRRHFSYLSRKGELDIETDDGVRVHGESAVSELLTDWDLDLDVDRRRTRLGPREDRAPPKLVHKLVFSMPPGTPPLKVLEAVQNFAREQFARQYRYAMVLHTDEPHPHVHMVVKAQGEQGERLNIRKATLREWRSEFARHLRLQGIDANATERSVRGIAGAAPREGIYRARMRGDATHGSQRADPAAHDLRATQVGLGSKNSEEARKYIRRGWWAASEMLESDGRKELAALVREFANAIPDVKPALQKVPHTSPHLLPNAKAREGPYR